MTTGRFDRPNREAVHHCLEVYLNAMRPFVVRVLRRKLRTETPEQNIRGLLHGPTAGRFEHSLLTRSSRLEDAIDHGILCTVITTPQNWSSIFRDEFPDPDKIRSAVNYIRSVRNSEEGHPTTKDTDPDTALTCLHHIAEVLRFINDPKQDRKSTTLTIVCCEGASNLAPQRTL